MGYSKSVATSGATFSAKLQFSAKGSRHSVLPIHCAATREQGLAVNHPWKSLIKYAGNVVPTTVLLRIERQAVFIV